ncbi:solute carrier family 22 member 6-A-like [Haliotis cracherodii]|uniref:solute carrier family 22 member 6-A-like n=1 Tax=Haliotis cracherodii TaxID=6455 RepID=UPI0039EB3E97
MSDQMKTITRVGQNTVLRRVQVHVDSSNGRTTFALPNVVSLSWNDPFPIKEHAWEEMDDAYDRTRLRQPVTLAQIFGTTFPWLFSIIKFIQLATSYTVTSGSSLVGCATLDLNMLYRGANRHYVPSHCEVLKNESTAIDILGFRENISDLNITYHECKISITSTLSGHSEDLACIEGHHYEQPPELSLVSEWDIVCEKESLGDLLQTLYMFGMGIGSVLFTFLSDKYGRKFSNILAGLCFLAAGTAMSFVPTYAAFAVMKVIQGATQMGVGLTSTTICLEIVPTRHRSKIGILNTQFWSISVVIYAFAAYLMRDLNWRYHQLVVGLTSAHYLISPWVMDESSRWLAARRKYSTIERNLEKASRMNNKDEHDIITLFREKVKAPKVPDQISLLSSDTHWDQHKPTPDVANTEGKDERPLMQIFKDRQILTLTAILCFIWMTDSLTYYGLSLNATQFHSDKFIGFGLNAVTEVFGSVAFWLTVDRFGRKKTCLACHLIAAVSLIASVIFNHFVAAVPTLSAAVSTFSLIGKFGATTSFNVLWLYTPEIFPTTMRNVGFGLGSLAARVGGILAPFSRILYRHYPWAPGTVFGTCCIVVAILVRFLPETNNIELPQTVTEMKQLLNQQRETQKKKQKKSSITENGADTFLCSDNETN